MNKELPNNQNEKNSKLFREVLRMEKLNSLVENSTDVEMRESMLTMLYKFDEQLKALEQKSELSEREILKMYDNFSREVAKNGISNLLVEMNEVDRGKAMDAFVEGRYDRLINLVNRFNPRVALQVAGIVLMLVLSGNISSVGATNVNIHTKDFDIYNGNVHFRIGHVDVRIRRETMQKILKALQNNEKGGINNHTTSSQKEIGQKRIDPKRGGYYGSEQYRRDVEKIRDNFQRMRQQLDILQEQLKRPMEANQKEKIQEKIDELRYKIKREQELNPWLLNERE